KSAELAGIVGSSSPELTVITEVGQSVKTQKPSARKASIMTSVSSLRRAPRRTQAKPFADSAASTRARLVMLLEPGTRIVAIGGCFRGTIVSVSGKDMAYRSYVTRIRNSPCAGAVGPA